MFLTFMSTSFLLLHRLFKNTLVLLSKDIFNYFLSLTNPAHSHPPPNSWVICSIREGQADGVSCSSPAFWKTLKNSPANLWGKADFPLKNKGFWETLPHKGLLKAQSRHQLTENSLPPRQMVGLFISAGSRRVISGFCQHSTLKGQLRARGI